MKSISAKIRLFCACAAALLCLPLVCHAQERCGIARDFTFQALERIHDGTNNDVEDGIQLLKQANEMCRSFGDAWYYRSLFERKLNQGSKADYSLSNAKKYGSEAMDQGMNPFTLAAPPEPGLKTLPPIHTKFALIVGISKFHDATLDLHFTSKDATDLSNVLKDPRFGKFPAANVHTLTDNVTQRRVKEELNWLAREAGPDDLVVIFLASHGTSRSQDTAAVSYVVTSDTDLKDQDTLFGTALGMAEISEIVRSRIRARRTVILLDTCHSGAAGVANKERALDVNESAPSESILKDISKGVGRAIVSSSSENQSSYEGTPFQNGYFTHFLVQAMQHDNGMDSIDQIFSFVKDNVSKAAANRATARSTDQRGFDTSGGAKKIAVDLGQTPVLTTSQVGGEIVIGAPAGK